MENLEKIRREIVQMEIIVGDLLRKITVLKDKVDNDVKNEFRDECSPYIEIIDEYLDRELTKADQSKLWNLTARKLNLRLPQLLKMLEYKVEYKKESKDTWARLVISR